MPYIEKIKDKSYVICTPFDKVLSNIEQLKRELNESLNKFSFAIFDKQTEHEIKEHVRSFILNYVHNNIVIIEGNKTEYIFNLLPARFMKLVQLPINVSFDYATAKLIVTSEFLIEIEKEENNLQRELKKLNKIVEEEEIAKLPYNIYYDYNNFHGEQFIKSDEDLNEMITAMKMLREEINDSCCDNFRCFPVEMNDAYNCIRSHGCCGFADGVFKCSSGNSYNYGFNYGH